MAQTGIQVFALLTPGLGVNGVVDALKGHALCPILRKGAVQVERDLLVRPFALGTATDLRLVISKGGLLFN